MSTNRRDMIALLLGAGLAFLAVKLTSNPAPPPAIPAAPATSATPAPAAPQATAPQAAAPQAAAPEPRRVHSLTGRIEQLIPHDAGSIMIFATPSMKAIANEIAALDDRVFVNDTKWERFPDQTPNIFIEGAHRLKWFHGVFLADFADPSKIFEQFSVIYALPRHLLRTFRVVVPFFSVGTMERVARIGEIATAKTLSRMLSFIPHSTSGPAQVCVFDMHTLQNQFYFSDNVLLRMHSCINLLLARLRALPDHNNISVAFPDDGAAKRFKARFKAYPIIICIKVREGNRRIVKIKDGDAKGRHVVIVDDLVQSGGTLIGCADAVRAQGAVTVSCFCTHAVFPNNAHEKFYDRGIDNFWVTNSNPEITAKLTRHPFEVLSIASRVLDVVSDPLTLADNEEEDT